MGGMEEPSTAATRLEVFSSIDVTSARGMGTALLVEISRSRASLLTDDVLGSVGHPLQLFLPQMEDVVVDAGGVLVRRGLPAAIVSLEPRGEKSLVRVALEPLGDAGHEHLFDAYLTSLLALAETDGGKRQSPRLVHRMSARYGDARAPGEVRDLSATGVGLRVRDTLVTGQECQVVLLDGAGEDLLSLTGVVRHQFLDARDAEFPLRLGIEFRRLVPERKQCLEALLRHYLALGSEVS